MSNRHPEFRDKEVVSSATAEIFESEYPSPKNAVTTLSQNLGRSAKDGKSYTRRQQPQKLSALIEN
jgi:hypothetical protein